METEHTPGHNHDDISYYGLRSDMPLKKTLIKNGT
jgi:hypothetical protein